MNTSLDPHFLRYGGILRERLPYDSRYRNSMGTKMAVAFANIFMSVVDPRIIETSSSKPLEWKRYNYWQCNFFTRSKKRGNWPLYLRSKQAPSQHQVQVQVLDTTTFNGERLLKESVPLHIFNLSETFQHTYFSSCHTPDVAKDFINKEALRLLKTRLLVGRGKKANFAGFSVTNSRKKGRFNANFAKIFWTNFAEKSSVKTG